MVTIDRAPILDERQIILYGEASVSVNRDFISIEHAGVIWGVFVGENPSMEGLVDTEEFSINGVLISAWRNLGFSVIQNVSADGELEILEPGISGPNDVLDIRHPLNLVIKFVSALPGRETIPAPIIIGTQEFVRWLVRQEYLVVGNVAEDGILALETRINPDVQLFVEIDRDGSVEAAISHSTQGITALKVSNLSDLMRVVSESLFGGA